jgi:hypothetical protein
MNKKGNAQVKTKIKKKKKQIGKLPSNNGSLQGKTTDPGCLARWHGMPMLLLWLRRAPTSCPAPPGRGDPGPASHACPLHLHRSPSCGSADESPAGMESRCVAAGSQNVWGSQDGDRGFWWGSIRCGPVTCEERVHAVGLDYAWRKKKNSLTG